MSIYKKYGVEPIINASGAVTRLGGAPMSPAVLSAFEQAASQSVSLEQLQGAASKQIARFTSTQAGLVTAGATAALTLGAAAIITGNDLGKMERLPHCEQMPCEFLIACDQRSGYDHAVRASGGRLVEVGFNEQVAGAGVRRAEAWEFDAAVTPETVGVCYVFSPTSRPHLSEVVQQAHRHDLPVLVDAAGQLLPRKNLETIVAGGADLIALSGGKAMRGPQSTGILCGRRDLVGAAALQMLDMDDHFSLWDPPSELIDREQLPGLPRHGIGRSMKVSKEEIVALLTAMELFFQGTYDREIARFRDELETIVTELAATEVSCVMVDPGDGQSLPVLEIGLPDQEQKNSALEICRRLRVGRPPIYLGHGKLDQEILVVNPLCLQDGDARTIADCLKKQLG